MGICNGFACQLLSHSLGHCKNYKRKSPHCPCWGWWGVTLLGALDVCVFQQNTCFVILCMDSCTFKSVSMCSGKVHVFFCTYLMCILIATGSVRVGVNLIHVAISYSFSQPPHLPPLGRRGAATPESRQAANPVVSRRSETTTQSDSR